MSILTKTQIIKAIEKKEIIFEPNLDSFQFSSISIDLRIGWSFYAPLTWKLNEQGRVAITADYISSGVIPENYQMLKLKPGQFFEILPGEYIITSTFEKITINSNKICGFLHPRSSSTRKGISIQSGVVDPFFSGYLVVPMRNENSHVLRVYPGERMCQIVFSTLEEEILQDDAGKHGLNDPKYYASTPYNLGIKPDPQDEISLLKNGSIEKIKTDYKTNQNVDK
jgi:dCTP deaminase